MRENWDKIYHTSKKLGDDLDVDLAWAEFKQAKKKRRMPIWIWPLIGVIGLGGLWLIYANLPTKKHQEMPRIIASEKNAQSLENTDNCELNVAEKIEDSASITKTNNQKVISILPTQRKAGKIRKQEIVIKRNGLEYSKDDSEYSKEKMVNNESFINEKVEEEIPQSTNLTTTSTHKIKERNRQHFQVIAKIESIASKVEMIKQTVEFSIPVLRKSRFKNQSLAFGFLYGWSMANRKIKAPRQSLGARRHANEEMLEYNHLKVYLRKELTNKFFISTGLVIGQYRSRFIDQYQNLIPGVVFDNQITEIRLQDNNREEIRGTIIGSQTEIINNKRYQKYLSITIPLEVGYKIELNENYHLNLATGLNYSIFNQAKGFIFEAGFSVGTYQNLNELPYRKFGLVQSNSSIELTRKIKERLNLLVGLQYEFDVNSRLNRGGFVDKFSAYGIRIGLGQRF